MATSNFEPAHIWGDDEGKAVYAQGYGAGLTTIFIFDTEDSKPPTSLARRICNSFHDLEADEEATFPDMKAMHQSLWAAVRTVWLLCLEDSKITALDAVVDIDSIDSSLDKITWKVYHHPLFSRFIQSLADDGRKFPYLSQSRTSVELTIGVSCELTYAI